MDGYQAGKLAKIAFFGTMLLALALQTCGKTIDNIPVQLSASVDATRHVAKELVADNVDAETVASAGVKIAQIAQALDKAGTPVSADTIEYRLYASTLYDVVSSRNLRRLCDREMPTAPELGPVRPSISEAFDRQLISEGFAVPEGRKREVALSGVNRLRTQLTVCLYRDTQRALANGSPFEDVVELVRVYKDRSNNTPVDLDGYRALFAKRDELTERLTTKLDGDAVAARATVLARLSENAIRRYPDLQIDLQQFLDAAPGAERLSSDDEPNEEAVTPGSAMRP